MRPSRSAAIAIGLCGLWLLVVGGAYLTSDAPEGSVGAVGMVGSRFITGDVLPSPPPASDATSVDLASDDQLGGHIVLSNSTDRDSTFALISLVDALQVAADIGDGPSMAPRAVVPSMREQAYRLIVDDPLAGGVRDFVQLVIWDPDSLPVDDETRLNTHDGYFSAHRVRVSVGAKAAAVASAAAPTVLPSHETSSPVGVIPNTVDDPSVLWLSERANPEERIDYTVHVGNPSDAPIVVSLVALLEWKQVALTGDVAPRVLVPPWSEISVPCTLEVPADPGLYEFQVFGIENPGSSTGQAPNAGVRCGPRLALEVRR